ncbi:hypothetical protein Vi05172_g11296 [Venturia inaequalis]|nr:hypothetical protein Vi05172_g11296 [Venturia inaequalis]
MLKYHALYFQTASKQASTLLTSFLTAPADLSTCIPVCLPVVYLSMCIILPRQGKPNMSAHDPF